MWIFRYYYILLNKIGLLYLRYNLKIRQFVQIDRYRGESNDVESQNRYLYCLNNPYKYVDRDGKFGFILSLIGAAVAAVVSYCALDYTIKNAGTIADATSKFISKAEQMIGNGLKKVRDTLSGIGKAVIGTVTAVAGTVGNNLSNSAKDFVDFVDDCLNYFPRPGWNDIAPEIFALISSLGLYEVIKHLLLTVDVNKTYKYLTNIHHIVPQGNHATTQDAKQVILETLLDINHNENLVTLHTNVHAHLHKETYYLAINIAFPIKISKQYDTVVTRLNGFRTVLKAIDRIFNPFSDL